MILREAHAGDEAFVVGLVPRFVENGLAGGHSREEIVEGTSRVLREAIRNPKRGEIVLIAEEEAANGPAEPAGFVYAITDRDFFTGEAYAHVSEIAVTHSGTGTGAHLMNAIERWARDRGYALVTLNVVGTNTSAQRFYERRGYALGHHHYIKRL